MFKKRLIKQLSSYLGRYVAENLVAQFMLNKHVYNLDGMSTKYRERFLNDFLDSTIGKFTSEQRLEEIRDKLMHELFRESKNETFTIKGITMHEIVNDPLKFLETIIGKYCMEVLLKQNEPQNLGQRIEFVWNILKVLYGQFYTDEQMKKLQDDLHDFIVGKYKANDINYVSYYTGPEKESILEKAKLQYFERVLKTEDYKKVVLKMSKSQPVDVPNFNIDEEMIKFLTLHFGSENAKDIQINLKYELKLYKLQYASLKHREEYYDMLLDRYFSELFSFAKLSVIRSKLSRILRIS